MNNENQDFDLEKYFDTYLTPTGKIEKINLVKQVPENLTFDYENDYWIDSDEHYPKSINEFTLRDQIFGTARLVIKDLLSERIKTVASKPKNKKTGYKNKQYENTAKKAELSPLLKNLIKNIK